MRKKEDYVQLKNDADELLDRLADRLPGDQLEGLRSFNSVAEWNELANNLLAILVQRQIPVSPGEEQAVRKLLYFFNLPVPEYDFINDRDAMLASLNVLHK